jgi:N4-(beta-N-acetylglucosaminyl)-L-asparaginase
MASPRIVSTWSFGQRGNDAAWPALRRGGLSIDAVERACQIVDADPTVDSVGFGGLPDASGRVSLDGCIMLGPDRCAGVCFVRRYMHPVSIARKVMDLTPHVMLAGEGAESFAEHQGFMPADLLSADASDAYRQWLRDRKTADQGIDKGYYAPRPIDLAQPGSGRLFLHPAPPERETQPPPGSSTAQNNRAAEDRWKHHDTIGVLAIDGRGVVAGACSTSGTPYKLPGRVGDSPIIGQGLYVDPKVGAVVATGTGELIMGVCASFLAVELMRRGLATLEALGETLQRILDSYQLRAEHQVALIALRHDGECASAALRPGFKMSIVDDGGSRVLNPDAVMLAD